jgi:hypothetical protein
VLQILKNCIQTVSKEVTIYCSTADISVLHLKVSFSNTYKKYLTLRIICYSCAGNSILLCPVSFEGNRDSSVVVALGYWLDDWGSRVRFPAGAGNFSFHYRVQNGSGAHPASYPMGTRGSFFGDKAAGA